MELQNYTNTKEEEYEVLAQHLNILADALINDKPELNLRQSQVINQLSQEALIFLKQLI